MSLTASIDPTENAFTGNPVYLSVETTSMVTYNIMHCLNFKYRRSLFTGNGNGSFKVNIAEVLETVFEDIPVLNGSSDNHDSSLVVPAGGKAYQYITTSI